MKKNLNIIQIKGTRGLILVACAICCLFVGFIVFPGWVCMAAWNFITSYVPQIPMINVFQGILLWAIILTSYFVFRKERLVVCMKAPQNLSEAEMKEMFADIKKEADNDPILQAMIKARDAELKKQKELLDKAILTNENELTKVEHETSAEDNSKEIHNV